MMLSSFNHTKKHLIESINGIPVKNAMIMYSIITYLPILVLLPRLELGLR